MLLFAAGSAAQTSIHTIKVSFDKGASGAALKGTIKGDDTFDYVVHAAAGQTMKVRLTTTNKSNYFNVNPPGNEAAIFIGSTTGYSFEGAVPETGNYTIRVYLMRNAARRNESAHYTLDISLGGK